MSEPHLSLPPANAIAQPRFVPTLFLAEKASPADETETKRFHFNSKENVIPSAAEISKLMKFTDISYT